MTLTLYHYLHCPFCVRVRLAYGFLGLAYQSQVIQYDDEKTPIDLTGVKMLPIVDFGKGVVLNESLDIIKRSDSENKLNHQQDYSSLEQTLQKIGSPIHNLVMPYWAYTPEFGVSAREYFTKKKEQKRGPFKQLTTQEKKEENLAQLSPLLASLEQELNPYYLEEGFSLADIMIASHLWGLYILPEFQFSPKIHHYLQNIKELCHFDYQQNLWSPLEITL